TWFFRDRDQLEQLAARLEARRSAGPLSVWVAGSSTGDEAYSLAILCAERAVDVRILATDLDRARLAIAERGIYAEHSLRALDAATRARWLEPIADGSWRVREPLRRVLSVRRHNLMDMPP